MAVLGDDALVGRVLSDRYLVGERIARGGMASVFLGQDQRLDRTVAIKVMHHGLGDDAEFTQRFEREARAAAKLNHRGVVAVFDQGTDGEFTYLVMEYVPGRTLRDLMRDEAPMKPQRALALLADVLVALSAAHAAHLIHRDVKPENVLITPDGDVKVADFGLARAVSAATTATGGTLIGTVSYLAPEIVVNEGADARSDVYACGAMLFEMLTGSKPHTGDSPIQVAYKHVHEDVEAPSLLQDGIPPYLDALVARATVRDRRQRSSDARVLLQQVRMVQRALDEGLEDDPALVADLLPRPLHDDDERTEAVVLAPAGPDEATVAVRREAVASERTMQWSSTDWEAPPVPGSVRPTGLHPPVSPEDYRAAQQPPPANRRGRALLLAVVLLAVLLAGVGYWLGVGRYADTPQLVGRSETQAVQEAEEAGFTFEVTRRAFSETAPLGTVISTDPAPGDRILPESTITAVVSKGKERYAIPNLKGQDLEQATRALEELKLEVGDTTEVFSETVAEGDVVRAVDRKVGDLVKRGTVIDLVLSKGRRPIEVQDQKGKPQAEAASALRQLGFQVAVRRAFSDDVDKGRVIRQDPASGTRFKGDTITLVVSDGPEEVTVPDVVGRPSREARLALEKVGFEVKVRNVIPGDEVRYQTPAGGKAKVGSTVTIYV